MRVLVSILFLAVAVFAEDPQAYAPNLQVPDNLTIPARLSKTIDTNKCKTGDPVELRTLESVLISNGVVMPENAKLHGRVLGSASRQNDKASWVVLLVERAEWKQHNIPLHAFVAAQITVKARPSGQTNNGFDNTLNQPGRRTGLMPRAPGRQAGLGMNQPLQDAAVPRNDAPPNDYQGLEDLRFLKDKNGNVFLVSQKQHLKLPSGAMFMLRNQATVEQPATDATKAIASAQ